MVTARVRVLELSAALLFTATFTAGAAAPATAQQDAERFTLSGDEVAIYDLAGRIDVVPGDGPDVVVEVRRGGRDAGQLRVETGPIDGRETLRVIFPESDVVYPELGRGSRTTLRVDGDGTFGDGGGWFDRRVEIRGSGGGSEAWADLRVRVPAGRRLDVHLGAGHAAVTDVDARLLVDASAASITAERTRGSLSLDTGSGSVIVRDTHGDLNIDTGSGRVEATNVGGDGDVWIDTGSGSVEASGIAASDIEIDAGSGSIDASDISASVVRIDTGSGRIRARDIVAAHVEFDTGSGSIQLGLLSDVEDLNIDTGSGGVTVSVPEGLAAEVEIETGSGGIDLDIPVETLELERSHFRGRIGNGGGRITIDTGSGSVRLVRGG